MPLDLGADVGELAAAFLGRAAVVGVLGTLTVLLVASWRPGRRLPRHALLAPMVVAAVASTGQIRVGALGLVGRLALLALVVVVAARGPVTSTLRELPLVVPLLLLTGAGLFACLPETGGAITLTTGTAAVLLIDRRVLATRTVLALLPVGVGLVVASDGIRAGQIVGGIAALGLLAVLPLVSAIPRVDDHFAARLRTRTGFVVALVTHALVVVAVARGPGIRPTVEPGGYALPMALALLGLAVLAHLPPTATGIQGQSEERRASTARARKR